MRWMVSALLRGAAFALIWLGLAGWSVDYALYGAFSVISATALSLLLLPPRERRPSPMSWPQRCWAAVMLVLWFLGQAARGGVDVALRALHRNPKINPQLLTVPVELPEGAGRQVAQTMMNLMPGTLIQAEAQPDEAPAVVLHTISAELEPAEQWIQLQHRVGRVFLQPPAHPPISGVES